MGIQELHGWTPREKPTRTQITGRYVELVPVDVRFAPDLLTAAQGDGADPDLWNYLGYGPFESGNEFTEWVESLSKSQDPLFFSVLVDGVASGQVSFMRMEPAHGVIEIGHIWFGGAMQRSRAATEAIYLLARTAFDDLGYRRLEWKCDAANARSRRAAERFGFTFEGVFRQHLVVKGRNRDTAWFSIIDSEWPEIRTGFERWLDDANFDNEGRQIQKLEALRG